MNQRRNFLKQVGLLSAVGLMQPGLLLAKAPALKVGLQLYTLRDYIGKDVKGVLAKVAKAGYTEVETYGYNAQTHFWGLAPKEFLAVLKANGLATSSGHYDLKASMQDGNTEALKLYIEAAKACGQTYIVVPYLDEQVRKTPDDFKALAARLNQAGELCRAAGLKLTYHNHDFEFLPVGGTTLYDVLLQQTQPALVDFELDLYWVVRAGRDPIKLLETYPGRFTMWHVKDMDRAKPTNNTEVGSGTINFAALFQHAQAAKLTHIFMEQENFAIDAFQSITQSAAYIKKKLLS